MDSKKMQAVAYTALCVLAIGVGVGVIVGTSCNHMTSAFVTSVSRNPEFGMCDVSIEYDAMGKVWTDRKRLPCGGGDQATGTVRGCYGHWRPGNFRVPKRNFISYPAAIFIIVFAFVVVLIAVAACVHDLMAIDAA